MIARLRSLLCILGMITLLTGELYSNKTEYNLRASFGLSLPISSHVSSYLESGPGGGISFIVKKEFWFLSLELSASFYSHSLQDQTDATYNQIPITVALNYKIPINSQLVTLSAYAESGLMIETLSIADNTDANTAFTFGFGSNFSINLSKNWAIGLKLGYSLVAENDETASFLRALFFVDLKL